MRISRKSSKAFTLVELLVAITIFAVIAGGLVGIFFSGVKLWRRANTLSYRDGDIYLGMEIFCRALKQNITGKDFNFSCKADAIEFTSPWQGSLYRFLFSFDPFSREMIMQKTEYVDNSSIKTPAVQKSVIFRAARAEFFYLVFDGKDRSFSWKSTAPGMPCAVKVMIKTGEKDFTRTIFIPNYGEYRS